MRSLCLILMSLVVASPALMAQTHVGPQPQGWIAEGTSAAIGGAAPDWMTSPEENAVYYALERTTVFATPDSSQPYVELDAGEPVDMLRFTHSWAEVKSSDGARGFVNRDALTNLWIRISKRSKTVWIHRGADVEATIPADMAYNFFLDKERRGSRVEPDHWRTPEGLYFVVSKNAQSRFYKAFVLNYPSANDARDGLSRGLISEHQYASILQAEERRTTPPMDTALGGWIEIHGEGTGARTTWTRGCVAIKNDAIDALWDTVRIGTPVLIES
ncbi:MAG: L,D-transpeptidase [Rhodothermales bacterium]|nr:L,D-transpeptidase [Rhodothermales bacterium]